MCDAISHRMELWCVEIDKWDPRSRAQRLLFTESGQRSYVVIRFIEHGERAQLLPGAVNIVFETVNILFQTVKIRFETVDIFLKS